MSIHQQKIVDMNTDRIKKYEPYAIATGISSGIGKEFCWQPAGARHKGCKQNEVYLKQ